MDKIKFFYSKEEEFLALPNSDITAWEPYLRSIGYYKIKTYGNFHEGFQLNIYCSSHDDYYIIDFSLGLSKIENYAFESTKEFITFMNSYKNFIDLIKQCDTKQNSDDKT